MCFVLIWLKKRIEYLAVVYPKSLAVGRSLFNSIYKDGEASVTSCNVVCSNCEKRQEFKR
jgi:hypothetical protein